MKAHRVPVLTISMLTALAGLHFLVPDKTWLYFSATDIAGGELWRILSGHFIHADTRHLLWNCLGFALLGALIEQYSRTMLWVALAAGILTVSLWLMMPFAQLDYYCGLSGALNTLLLLALWLEWTRSRSPLIIIIAIASILKVVIEVSQGSSILTHISWPPYAWSHVAGLIGGGVVILIRYLVHQRSTAKPRPARISTIQLPVMAEQLH